MHYDYEYFYRTSKIDMRDNYKFFLKYFNGKTILDLGCGSGRDSNHFIQQNCKVYSVDNSEYAKQFAKDEYDINVELTDIRKGITGMYDGIWSCASLVHMNKKEVLSVLDNLKHNLNPNGLIYISLKYGDETIEKNNQVYYLYKDNLGLDIAKLGYEVLNVKITEDTNAMNNWIEFILKKK